MPLIELTRVRGADQQITSPKTPSGVTRVGPPRVPWCHAGSIDSRVPSSDISKAVAPERTKMYMVDLLCDPKAESLTEYWALQTHNTTPEQRVKFLRELTTDPFGLGYPQLPAELARSIYKYATECMAKSVKVGTDPRSYVSEERAGELYNALCMAYSDAKAKKHISAYFKEAGLILLSLFLDNAPTNVTHSLDSDVASYFFLVSAALSLLSPSLTPSGGQPALKAHCPYTAAWYAVVSLLKCRTHANWHMDDALLAYIDHLLSIDFIPCSAMQCSNELETYVIRRFPELYTAARLSSRHSLHYFLDCRHPGIFEEAAKRMVELDSIDGPCTDIVHDDVNIWKDELDEPHEHTPEWAQGLLDESDTLVCAMSIAEKEDVFDISLGLGEIEMHSLPSPPVATFKRAANTTEFETPEKINQWPQRKVMKTRSGRKSLRKVVF